MSETIDTQRADSNELAEGNMEAVAQETSTTEATTQPKPIMITFEVVAYVALIVLALVLRLAELDTVPLTAGEARQALASWRVVHPEAVGTTILPDSALLFTLHNITFTALGASEFSARILTALAGVALALSPLLFRELFGRVRVLILCVFLALSPAVLISSRYDSPMIWAALLVIWGGWALWCYSQGQRPRYALIAAGAWAAAAFLTGTGGLLLVLIAAVSAVLASFLNAGDDPEQPDLPQPDLASAVRTRFAKFPWQMAGIVAVAVVVLVPTVFMIYPSGLSSVSQSFGGLLSGLATAKVDIPFSPLVMSLYYEPFLWGLALAAVWLLSRRAAFSWFERFFMVWTIVALIVSVFYAGSTPDFSLWFILPLAGLASYVGAALLIDDEQYAVRVENDQFVRVEIPVWAKWLTAAAVFVLMVILGEHLANMGRSFLTMPTGSSIGDILKLTFNDTRYVATLRSLIWAVLALMFLVAGYFMVSSYWNPTTAGRGMTLGLLIFGVFSSAGSGWNAAVPNADSALEPWHLEATGSEVFLLRKTLIDLAQRSNGGFYDLPIAALAPDDGVIAWTLRDFSSTRFLGVVADGRLQPVVLLPQSNDAKPDLGGNYVGQRFIISRGWQVQAMPALDWIAWWTQRRSRVAAYPLQAMILWVRQDIYDGAQTGG